MNAAAQNFNSVGIAFGSMIAFASYNKVNNRSIMMDTMVICCLNSATSILAGIIVFATLGNIAKELQSDIKDVVVAGKPSPVSLRTTFISYIYLEQFNGLRNTISNSFYKSGCMVQNDLTGHQFLVSQF